jgi:superfamily II DNA/RNA helicase
VLQLSRAGVGAEAIHGNRNQNQRQRALEAFAAGHPRVLVATDVAARGIDVDHVTRVINFDAPEDRDTYVHRVGRTGRAGRTGSGVSFVMADQAADMRKIAQELGLHDEFGLSAPNASRTKPRPQQAQRNGNGKARRRNNGRRR